MVALPVVRSFGCFALVACLLASSDVMSSSNEIDLGIICFVCKSRRKKGDQRSAMIMNEPTTT